MPADAAELANARDKALALVLRSGQQPIRARLLRRLGVGNNLDLLGSLLLDLDANQRLHRVKVQLMVGARLNLNRAVGVGHLAAR